MSEALADTDRAQALKLAERARVLDPNATRALARLEGGAEGSFASPRAGFLHGPNTAISVAAIPAVPPRRAHRRAAGLRRRRRRRLGRGAGRR